MSGMKNMRRYSFLLAVIITAGLVILVFTISLASTPPTPKEEPGPIPEVEPTPGDEKEDIIRFFTEVNPIYMEMIAVKDEWDYLVSTSHSSATSEKEAHRLSVECADRLRDLNAQLEAVNAPLATEHMKDLLIESINTYTQGFDLLAEYCSTGDLDALTQANQTMSQGYTIHLEAYNEWIEILDRYEIPRE